MIQMGMCKNNNAPNAAIFNPHEAVCPEYDLEGIESSESAGDKKINYHNHNRTHGHRGGERNISSRSLIRIDCLADKKFRVAEAKRDYKITQGQRECEYRACHHSWKCQRQNNITKRLKRFCT